MDLQKQIISSWMTLSFHSENISIQTLAHRKTPLLISSYLGKILEKTEVSCLPIAIMSNTDIFNPLFTGNLYMVTLTNSEDTDEMQHDAAFHQGLQCLLRFKQNSLQDRNKS